MMFQDMWGLDMRRNLEPAVEFHGRYSTDLFTDEAVQIIEYHNSTDPLFLYFGYAAVYSGNPYKPLAAIDSLIDTFGNNIGYYRQLFAGWIYKKKNNKKE